MCGGGQPFKCYSNTWPGCFLFYFWRSKVTEQKSKHRELHCYYLQKASIEWNMMTPMTQLIWYSVCVDWKFVLDLGRNSSWQNNLTTFNSWSGTPNCVAQPFTCKGIVNEIDSLIPSHDWKCVVIYGFQSQEWTFNISMDAKSLRCS